WRSDGRCTNRANQPHAGPARTHWRLTYRRYENPWTRWSEGKTYLPSGHPKDKHDGRISAFACLISRYSLLGLCFWSTAEYFLCQSTAQLRSPSTSSPEVSYSSPPYCKFLKSIPPRRITLPPLSAQLDYQSSGARTSPSEGTPYSEEV